MGKMLDNARAWWNSLADNFGDPGKLAQLSVADLEKGIRKAKEAAAPVIGRPSTLETKLADLKQTDQELTKKITTLLQSGGKDAALKYIERQVAIRKEIESVQDDYEDNKAAADEWRAKIRALETQLYERRNAANKLQAQYETAKAEQTLGKHMQNADGLLASDQFSSIQARVDKERAKAAGYSAMSGLDDRINDEKIIRDAQTDALLDEYMRSIDKKEN
ncbi:MAG: PspA/IM30 family protein [Clostridiales bacterium]|jgi:phage shock protein A|nr:PspA/IM30 family protein [Clostridiales bacterium]